MKAIFSNQIGCYLEVSIDDMIIMTSEGKIHITDMEDVLESIRNYSMRIKRAKCSFGIQADKFLGFKLTEIGI